MIEWFEVGYRVPDNRREVLAWGWTTFRSNVFLGVTRFNPSRDGGEFDIEKRTRFVPFSQHVTHWAEIEGPAYRGHVPPRPLPGHPDCPPKPVAPT